MTYASETWAISKADKINNRVWKKDSEEILGAVYVNGLWLKHFIHELLTIYKKYLSLYNPKELSRQNMLPIWRKIMMRLGIQARLMAWPRQMWERSRNQTVMAQDRNQCCGGVQGLYRPRVKKKNNNCKADKLKYLVNSVSVISFVHILEQCNEDDNILNNMSVGIRQLIMLNNK